MQVSKYSDVGHFWHVKPNFRKMNIFKRVPIIFSIFYIPQLDANLQKIILSGFQDQFMTTKHSKNNVTIIEPISVAGWNIYIYSFCYWIWGRLEFLICHKLCVPVRYCQQYPPIHFMFGLIGWLFHPMHFRIWIFVFFATNIGMHPWDLYYRITIVVKIYGATNYVGGKK